MCDTKTYCERDDTRLDVPTVMAVFPVAGDCTEPGLKPPSSKPLLPAPNTTSVSGWLWTHSSSCTSLADGSVIVTSDHELLMTLLSKGHGLEGRVEEWVEDFQRVNITVEGR